MKWDLGWMRWGFSLYRDARSCIKNRGNSQARQGSGAGVVAAFCLAMAAGGMFPASAWAQLSDPHFGVTLKGGTTGAGIDLTKSLFPDINLRVGYNRFEFSHDFTEGGIPYDGDFKLESVPILLDWHVFSGWFRVSAGAFYNGNDADLTTRPNSNITIGNTTFTPAQVGTLNGDVDFGNPVVPYLGIGWGNAVGKNGGWGLSLDIGVFYQGEPDVNLTQSGGAVTISAADLAQEERELEEELDDFKFYPVATLGVHYRF